MSIKKILVVEDDKNLSDMITDYLEIAGYEVITARDGQTALSTIDEVKDINLLVTDLKLPSFDGMEICRYVRAKKELNNLPILMMTGKSDIMTKYLGFEAGSDDYISKPFEPMEFLLKIKSLIRRTEMQILNSEEHEHEMPKEETKEEELNLNNEISAELNINGKVVNLTPIELDIFTYLYNNNNRIVTSEELLNQVMSYPKGAGNPEAIRTHIKNIRRKIEKNRDNPEIITHVPKKGYYFNKNKIDLSLGVKTNY